MKNKILTLITLLLFLNSCEDPFIISTTNTESEDILIIIPDEIEIEESINDPQETGVACSSNANRALNTEIIEVVNIPLDLPLSHDLSENMPPVRSQGSQGSCVAWATTYYLKSYQEKIQHNYDYESYEDVMSPAFIYNQAKANPNCLSGSTIEDSLELLKTAGTNTWQDFPYSQEVCTLLPRDELLLKASENKIKEYFKVAIPDSNTDLNYTLVSLIKTLVFQKNPIVISMDFENLVFETINGNYITNTFNTNPTDKSCGHAILIVGYDDDLNAFKIVNSWGTKWGNEGYAWVSYNYFVEQSDSNYQKGLTGSYVAFDED